MRHERKTFSIFEFIHQDNIDETIWWGKKPKWACSVLVVIEGQTSYKFHMQTWENFRLLIFASLAYDRTLHRNV